MIEVDAAESCELPYMDQMTDALLPERITNASSVDWNLRPIANNK